MSLEVFQLGGHMSVLVHEQRLITAKVLTYKKLETSIAQQLYALMVV